MTERALDISVRVNCAPDHAFAVFTNRVDLWWPPSHRRCAGSTLELDAVPGGRLVERAENGDEATIGDVLDSDPPHWLRLSWHLGKISAPTHVTVTFQADGAQTLVAVHHAEGDSAMGDQWPARAAMFDRGWTAVLAALAEFITKNEG